MDIQAKLIEKIKRFEDLKNQIAELSKKIGGLTEQQRALYNQGLEMKGQIDTLVELQNDEAAKLATSKTAGLTLPEGVKPVIPDAPASAPVAEAAPAVEATPEAPAAAPIALEVK